MKRKELCFAFVMGIILPGMIFVLAEKLLPIKNKPLNENSATTVQMLQQTDPQSEPVSIVPVLLKNGKINQMGLEEYLVGVLLGEMPMEFNMEALKAQAIVARTYALRRYRVAPKHDEGAICVNSACCQSFCSPESFLSNGGTEDEVNKAISAVSLTAGKVIIYNGALIDATYFSCSGGRTEAALAVWGADVPYLQSVDSPGEENATHYTDSVIFSKEEFAEKLGLSLSGDSINWFGAITYTDGGGVDTMIIGGVAFKGTELRQKLAICSTVFTVTPLGNDIFISTKGFGHRVGMSQYGAEAMAEAGSNYEEILMHYYPGTSISDNYN